MPVPFYHSLQEYPSDILDWYLKFQTCSRYFVDHAQHSGPIQSVAALINIKLPYQKSSITPPISTSGVAAVPDSRSLSTSSARRTEAGNDPSVALLIPYIRRLVATSFDSPLILRGFFGDDWEEGIGHIHKNERRNYLLAAKSDTWLAVKTQYDMDEGQFIPNLHPLQSASLPEIEAAEADWSNWLAMQDWMLGPRAPMMGFTKTENLK